MVLRCASLSSTFCLPSRRRVCLSGSRDRLYLIIPFGMLVQIAAEDKSSTSRAYKQGETEGERGVGETMIKQPQVGPICPEEIGLGMPVNALEIRATRKFADI